MTIIITATCIIIIITITIITITITATATSITITITATATSISIGGCTFPRLAVRPRQQVLCVLPHKTRTINNMSASCALQ